MRRISNTELCLAILKIFQTLALSLYAAKLIINHDKHLYDFVSKIKESKQPDVQYHSFQIVRFFNFLILVGNIYIKIIIYLKKLYNF